MVAMRINLHPVTILNLINKGDFPEGHRIEEKGILRFDPKEVERWRRDHE
jgi:predicted DNA-binding transcriptional regulator AlpA